MMVLEAVHVIWLDASACGDWQAVTDIERRIEPTHTIGWLLHSDAEVIVLAATYDPSTQTANAVMTIPQVCVQRVAPVLALRLK